MSTLSADFTAVGNGGAKQVLAGDKFSYLVEGTFVGTWVLQQSVDQGQTWQQLATGAATQTVTEVKPDTAGRPSVLVRFICSAFTSGTIETNLADVAVEVASFADGMLVLTEAGAEVAGTFAADGAITSGGVAVPTVSSTSTLTNKTLTSPVINTPSIATPSMSNPAMTGNGTFADLVGSGLALTKAGFAGSVALTIGVDATHGLQFKQIDEVVDLSALGAKSKALTTPIPAGAVIISAQANIDELVVAGGTTVKVALGLAAGDVDKYGKSADLVLNTKFNTLADWAVLAAEEAIAVCGVTTDGSALGDSNITAGKVHVRIVYLQLASLANA